MKNKLKSGAAFVGLMMASTLAHANTLNLNGGLPDIGLVSNSNVSYVPSSGDFSYTNQGNYDGVDDMMSFAYGSNDDFVVGTYDLSADIDSTTGLLTGTNNTLTITGWDFSGYAGVPDFSNYTAYETNGPTDTADGPITLLTGTLTDVGFNSSDPDATSGNVIAFTFTPTGGAFASLYGTSGGISINVSDAQSDSGPVTPSFSTYFYAGDSDSTVDNYIVVPTPETLTGGALLLGLLGAAVRRRGITNRA